MSIAIRAVSGAAWNLVAGVGSRLITLVGTLVLTRFIAPDEYGEIAVASITILTAMVLTDMMVGQSIVARHVDNNVCFHAFVLHVGTGIAAMLAVFLLADRLAVWLDAPGMARFLPGFAAAALLERVAYVPGRILVRDMRFRTLAVTRGTAELLFTTVAIPLAPFIHGYAVVAGGLARSALALVAYLARLDRREWWVPQRLRWSVIRDLVHYGLPLTVATIAEFASGNWDNLIVVHFFGTSTGGAYKLSRSLADTPIANVADHMADVLMPSMAQMEPARRKDALARSAAIIVLVVAPFCMGLAAVAPALIGTLFDPRWNQMAPMLMILSSLAIFRPVAWPLSSFLQAQQRPRALMFLYLFKVAVTLLFLVTIGRLGPLWACFAIRLAWIVAAAATLLAVQKMDGVPARAFAIAALRPLVAAILMFGAVVGVGRAAPALGLVRPWALLFVEVAVGGAVYAAAAMLVARPIIGDVLQLLRRAFARKGE